MIIAYGILITSVILLIGTVLNLADKVVTAIPENVDKLRITFLYP
jgi:hypothetical protein